MGRKLTAAIALVSLVVGAFTLVAVIHGDDDGGADDGQPRAKLDGVGAPPRAKVRGDTITVGVPCRGLHPVDGRPTTFTCRPREGRSFAIVRLRRGRVPLRSRPGGPVVRTIGPRTEFDSPRSYAVVRRRGSWLGVSTPLRPNGRLGWLRLDSGQLWLYWTRYSLRADLTNQRLELRYGHRLLDRIPVTVGAAGTSTPPGRFAVTDGLVYEDSPYYGCCALPLSGRQPNLPPGWLGGDRIAIHGTSGPVGGAASSGCLRASNADMRDLMRRVPLGTPVFVRE